MNLQKNNFTQKYSCNDDEYVINSNLVNNGFISLDKFCEITKSTKVGGNTIAKDGFSFDATIDDFLEKMGCESTAEFKEMLQGLYNAGKAGDTSAQEQFNSLY